MTVEWITLKTEADISRLMNDIAGFHDGCLRESHIWTETYANEHYLHVETSPDTHLRLFFHVSSIAMSSLELEFDEVLEFRYAAPPDNCDSIISGASFSLKDGVFALSVSYIGLPLTGPPGGSISKKDMPETNAGLIVMARKAKYRNTGMAMGDKPMYGYAI